MSLARKSARIAAITNAGGSSCRPTGTVAAACSAAMNASRSARPLGVLTSGKQILELVDYQDQARRCGSRGLGASHRVLDQH